jgi:L-seryl-tRNA(Ser) seleniumtransferase
MTTTGKGNVYAKLGVRPIINAQGNRTVAGGSAPTPEVARAMEDAANVYVEMEELLARSGEFIAELLGVEAAYVTSGCSAALALSAAACMAGRDPDHIARLPDTTGMKNEVVLQKAQQYSYDRSFTVPGATIVRPGDEDGCTREQLEAAIGPQTAALAYLIRAGESDSVVSLEDVVEMAHARGIPVIADAAARIYPLDYFRRNAQSADLVCFGAKYLGAPQSAGFVCGRKDLVDAVVEHGFIGFQTNGGLSFGRPMKLDKQEIVGVVTAVEQWFIMNHEDRLIGYEERLSAISGGLQGVAGVESDLQVVDQYYVTTLQVKIDTATVGKTAQDVADELDAGSPRIWVTVVDDDTITVNSHALNEGENMVVAERLRMALGG